MDRESLLALIEKNQGAGLIYVDELPDNNDPELPQMIEEFKKKYLRPECFPPELKHLMPKLSEDLSQKD